MTKETQNITSPTQFGEHPAGIRDYWLEEINAAKKELEKWHKRGKQIVNIYLDNRTITDDNNRNFNLFAANTGILKSSLYARIPKPDVERRFMDFDDDIARVASIILQRTLSYELENDAAFDTNARNIIEDRILPGLGTAWVRYDTERVVNEVETTEIDAETGELITSTETSTEITDEQTPIDYVHWRDFFWSPARTWAEVRWVARRVYMSKDELVERFGEEVAKTISLASDDKAATNTVEPQNKVILQAEIYEIWDKTQRKIFWLSVSSPEILDQKDDPYELPNFFPCPKPLLANTTTSNLVPTPDYALVQDQYAELNELNNRISSLVAACKVAGVYDKQFEGLATILKDGRENILIPVDKWAAFAEKGGIAGSIAFLPIQQIAEVLIVLQKARDIIKGQIYELTGISDIIRGSTNPYETAQAQQIKSQFASLRLNALQNEVACFFSELVQIKAHLMMKFYDPQRFYERSGTLNSADQQYLSAALQLLKTSQSFEYRINVSVDALQIPNFDFEKKQRTEAITAISSFIERAVPAASRVPELGPLLLTMLKWGVAGFHGTQELEGILDVGISQLQVAQQKAAQAPKPLTAEMLEQQNRAKKLEQDLIESQSRISLETQRISNEFELEKEKLRLKAVELDIEKAKLNINSQITMIANQTEANLQNRALDIKTLSAHSNHASKSASKIHLNGDMLTTVPDGLVNSNSPSVI